MTDNHTSITIRLPQEMRNQLTALAKAEDLTDSQFVRRHLRALIPAKPARKGGNIRKGERV